ncbi:MAG: CapA family protein [Bacillota bacterium]
MVRKCKDRFDLAVTGDSFLATRISCYDDPDFLAVFDIIRKHTAGFTNLEVLLNDWKGIPAADSGGTYAGASSSLVDEFKWAGFHMVSRANNHSLDYSYEGLRRTTEVLDKAGICHAGVGENLAAAREPAYLETPKGRAALLSASSTFAPWGRAGHQRPDFQGRPGLSPVRYSTYYSVTREEFDFLKKMEESMGISELKAQAKKAGYLKERDNELVFSGLRFVLGDKSGIHTVPNSYDVAEITKWIKDAKRQADWVFYTLHAHEAHLKREVPAEFIETFARACIDAGADAFIGHGPHVLRGIEIYRGKPIFYSLGNFIFQNDLIRKHPQDIYDKVGQGLTMGSTPADMYDARSRNDTRGFPSDVAYWESVLGSLEFAGGEFRRATLYPLYLGWDNPRSQRGRPTLAREEIAKRILERLQTLSEPYGTNLRIEGEVGIIEV